MPEHYYRRGAGFELLRTPHEGRRRATIRAKNILLDFLFSQLERLAGDRAVFALQVGANDGRVADPLFRQFVDHGWHGLLLEPLPAYFARAHELHNTRPHVEVVNVGCSSEPSKMTLFHLNPDYEGLYPRYARGCASLDKERLIQTLAKCTSDTEANAHFCETEIRLEPLSEIVAQRLDGKVDLLVVDVEGHEPQVLRGSRLELMMPSLAIVEINTPDAREDTIRFFRDLDYTLFSFHADMIALSPQLADLQTLADFCAFMGASPI